MANEDEQWKMGNGQLAMTPGRLATVLSQLEWFADIFNTNLSAIPVGIAQVQSGFSVSTSMVSC